MSGGPQLTPEEAADPIIAGRLAELRALAAFEAAVEVFLDAARPAWHLGDGVGGYVLQAVMDAAAGRGWEVGRHTVRQGR